jgi:hypothetical protein
VTCPSVSRRLAHWTLGCLPNGTFLDDPCNRRHRRKVWPLLVPKRSLPMRYRSSLIWLAAAPLVIGACTRGTSRATGFRLSPDVAAVQSCASSIALNEGYEVSGRTGMIGAPSDGNNWTERLELRVRVSGDSVLPNARIRTATYSGRSSAPVSPAGNRIITRVNRECRLGRRAE